MLTNSFKSSSYHSHIASKQLHRECPFAATKTNIDSNITTTAANQLDNDSSRNIANLDELTAVAGARLFQYIIRYSTTHRHHTIVGSFCLGNFTRSDASKWI
jgi:hypothetical protein